MKRVPYAPGGIGWFVTALLLLGPAAWAQPSASLFFTPPTVDPGATLDPNGIYPQGQMLGFGLYSIVGQNDFDPTKTNMQRVADAGFTLAGPYYGESDLDSVYEAAANGLRHVFMVKTDTTIQHTSVADGKWDLVAQLTDQQIEDLVRPQIEAVFNDPTANATVAQWSIQPEEIPANQPAGINYLQVAANTIRQVEDEHQATHRPIWVYEPNSASADRLTTVGQGNEKGPTPVDMIGKGIYLTSYDRGDKRSGYQLWSLEQINTAAQNLNATPFAVYQLSQDFTDPTIGTDPATIKKVLRHDVYLGLVHGMKDLEIWSDYENRPNFTTHEQQFDGYASVASDLTGDLDLQKVFLFGEKRNDLTFLQMDGQTTIGYKGENFDAISTLDLAYGDDRYLFLVNSAEENALEVITGLPWTDGYQVEDLFTGTTYESHDPFLNVGLTNLEVRAFKLSPLSGFRQSNVPEPASGVAFMLVSGVFLFRRRSA